MFFHLYIPNTIRELQSANYSSNTNPKIPSKQSKQSVPFSTLVSQCNRAQEFSLPNMESNRLWPRSIDIDKKRRQRFGSKFGGLEGTVKTWRGFGGDGLWGFGLWKSKGFGLGRTSQRWLWGFWSERSIGDEKRLAQDSSGSSSSERARHCVGSAFGSLCVFFHG